METTLGCGGGRAVKPLANGLHLPVSRSRLFRIIATCKAKAVVHADKPSLARRQVIPRNRTWLPDNQGPQSISDPLRQLASSVSENTIRPINVLCKLNKIFYFQER